jgi:hypothetical protein
MDKLHGILTTYQLRTKQENPSRREASFKTSNKTRKKKPRSKPYSSNSDDPNNEEESNFVTNLKRGTDKNKGKLSFKFFNCGKVGYFSSKFPYARVLDSDEE